MLEIAAPPQRPATPAAADKPSLVGLSRAGLAGALQEIGIPERQVKMRAAQLWHWLYVRGATDFGAMTNM
ncbi:MAG TPA: 23S rRNA (adenine(2503)-C(2))-methyltransferase RlmN, partial [Bauldia sp.]|nr:23S rRNA (adenine(2503)-C(2))-methyltransferase RlmN [Bauldia sp.]